jgi:hypothetical protein
MRTDEDMFLDKFAGQVLANLIVHHRYQRVSIISASYIFFILIIANCPNVLREQKNNSCTSVYLARKGDYRLRATIV